MVVFRRLLANALVGGVMSSFLWFALTFWTYLETRSVVATSIIGGSYAIAAAGFGLVFGSFVDRHRKHTSMVVASVAALACFAAATALYAVAPADEVHRLGAPWFWALVLLVMLGSVVGNLRSIALSTCVTLLVADGERDKANGLVGATMGISFTLTSVFSGLVIGQLGMGWALALSTVVSALALVHLLTIEVPEAPPEATGEHVPAIDVRGAVEAIRRVPGLFGLIGFAACNNLLGGVFMSLMDAYGLEIVSVETWGVLFAVLSLGFVVGGLVVARRGLGSRPLRVALLCNLANWAVCSVFTVRTSIVLLSIGMFVWLVLMPVIEAAEQTVLQTVVPFDQQGRVFGFAQAIENAASPITALAIGPIAQLWVIPFMTDGAGADSIGSWFGTGTARGIALIFTVAGLLGIVLTGLASASRWYRSISHAASASHQVQPA
ncbi:MAG: MFS transporter [Ilumatobacteraceae bacterium]|nr:MFS transporter [Acidimicrobiales bacterium]MCB9393630.1 MFS transporter [Acidimicrobiaceae bacterium]